MAESNANIDVGSDSTGDKVGLLGTLPDVSSFGEMCDITQNIEEYEDLRNSVKTPECGAHCSNVPNDDDIPTVTIKNKKESEVTPEDIKKYQDYQRVLPMRILSIMASKLIIKKPSLYNFYGENYRFVEISGTVTSTKSTKENKATIEVDDGTGVISCLVENTEEYFKLRHGLNKILDAPVTNPMSKEEVNKFGEMEDDEFLEKVGDRKNPFLRAISQMFAEKMKKNLERKCPFIEDINIGDNVILVGAVSDYMDQRFIFVKHLNRVSDISTHLSNMSHAFQDSDSD